MSKWPPSTRFPYGYGKMDSLSGFANGIFLMLISVEIIYEAVERLGEGHELSATPIMAILTEGTVDTSIRKSLMQCISMTGIILTMTIIIPYMTTQITIISTTTTIIITHTTIILAIILLIGLNIYLQAPTVTANPTIISSPPRHLVHRSTPQYQRPHPNLHTLIPILIPIATITAHMVTTTLTKVITCWVFICTSQPTRSARLPAIPLVKTSARNLLLTVPAGTEYDLREALTGLSGLRGIASYAVPKFWLESGEGSEVLGVIHVIAGKGADLEDVKERAIAFLKGRHMNVVVQVEREGNGRCWCQAAK
ncbi:hypothetical protein P7C71_g1621, partial [Lecanoromycetidae sp. Uapishka_2]